MDRDGDADADVADGFDLDDAGRGVMPMAIAIQMDTYIFIGLNKSL